MKNHLAGTHIQVKPCSQVPEDVKMKFQELLVAKKVNKDDDDDDMVDIFKQQDVNPNTGKIDSFLSKGKKGSGSNSKQRTLNEVVKDREKLVGDYGRGLKPPTCHEARVSYLKREVDLVGEKLGKYKNEWKKDGCTLMSDGWTDGKGEEHVIQVVTDGASNYVAIDRMLEKKRRKPFWSPCAAHCLDLILEDIGKITDKELTQPAVTRFATSFLTLSCIMDSKLALRPFHATAYYLNPKYHYDPNFNPDKEVKIGLYKVIEKMYPDVETRVEVDAQLDKFKRGWIMEKEDPCLTDDNSWMDVQECFNIDEDAPNDKRARDQGT
ncbi:hypothetical protein Pint_20429 [Pistacia integerrima]|uniref:Uncharacterized protein n=1 Tax=Pistacia integerrima TaxID=434235 RepID=A0ACC0XCX1_9ROSI|nr:hypothetical protein Pint_20429 [Pistacia integerrima]